MGMLMRVEFLVAVLPRRVAPFNYFRPSIIRIFCLTVISRVYEGCGTLPTYVCVWWQSGNVPFNNSICLGQMQNQ